MARHFFIRPHIIFRETKASLSTRGQVVVVERGFKICFNLWSHIFFFLSSNSFSNFNHYSSGVFFTTIIFHFIFFFSCTNYIKPRTHAYKFCSTSNHSADAICRYVIHAYAHKLLGTKQKSVQPNGGLESPKWKPVWLFLCSKRTSDFWNSKNKRNVTYIICPFFFYAKITKYNIELWYI